MSGLPTYSAPSNGQLSAEMLAAYNETGVLILEDYVSLEQCQRLQKHTLELVDAFDPTQVRHVFSTTGQNQLGDAYFEQSGDKVRFFLEKDAFDSGGVLKQSKEHSLNKMGHAMHDLDPVFDDFSRTAKLAGTVDSLGFNDPVILQSMYIFKPPRIGGEVVCHQDSTYLYTDPQSCVGFWFALEDATLENGCMQFIPGGHKLGLKERNYRGVDGKLTFEAMEHTPWKEGSEIPAEARAGTLVIFDGRSPHLSAPNVSPRSRHAYTLHVIDRACRYPQDNWLQRNEELPLRGFRT